MRVVVDARHGRDTTLGGIASAGLDDTRVLACAQPHSVVAGDEFGVAPCLSARCPAPRAVRFVTIKVVRFSKPRGPTGSTRSSVGLSACTRMLPTTASHDVPLATAPAESSNTSSTRIGSLTRAWSCNF